MTAHVCWTTPEVATLCALVAVLTLAFVLICECLAHRLSRKRERHPIFVSDRPRGGYQPARSEGPVNPPPRKP